MHGRRCRKSLDAKCTYDDTAVLSDTSEGVMYTLDVQVGCPGLTRVRAADEGAICPGCPGLIRVRAAGEGAVGLQVMHALDVQVGKVLIKTQRAGGITCGSKPARKGARSDPCNPWRQAQIKCCLSVVAWS